MTIQARELLFRWEKKNKTIKSTSVSKAHLYIKLKKEVTGDFFEAAMVTYSDRSVSWMICINVATQLISLRFLCVEE